MTQITVKLSCEIEPTFRAHQIAGMFDMPLTATSRQTFVAEVPSIREDWTIGAIVGPSGSGKSSIAAAAYRDYLATPEPWPHDRAVVEGFGNLPIKQITQALTSVGFSSPPAWLRPYRVLSNGERFRCDLARALLADEPLVVFDEFTSVVDRTVAKIGSAAIAKALRAGRLAKRFVAVTCHYDVIPWLEADWVVDMESGRLTWGRLRRPAIDLHVVRVRQSVWRYFARHHYLSGSLSRGATCYVALWGETPVAFCALVGMLGHSGHKRVTRLVTLPDYQGLGIGTRLLEHLCQQVVKRGERVSITTSHPAMCSHLANSPRWKLSGVRRCGRASQQVMRDQVVRDSQGRAVASFEYLAPRSTPR